MAILFHPPPPTCIFVGPCFHPPKKIPRKKSWKGKIYVAWRTIANSWEKIAFSGKNPSTLFKTRSCIYHLPKKLNSDRNCWDFHSPPLFWRENIPMGKPSTMTSTTTQTSMTWAGPKMKKCKRRLDSTRGGWRKTCRKIEKKKRGESPRWWFHTLFFMFHTRSLGTWSNFDEHIFQMGWNQPPTRKFCLSRCKKIGSENSLPRRVEIPKPIAMKVGNSVGNGKKGDPLPGSSWVGGLYYPCYIELNKDFE